MEKNTLVRRTNLPIINIPGDAFLRQSPLLSLGSCEYRPNSTWLDSTRLVSTRHDSTRSTCRAHAFWLCRASRRAQLDSLDTTSSTGSTGSTKSNVSSRVESSQVEFGLLGLAYRAGLPDFSVDSDNFWAITFSKGAFALNILADFFFIFDFRVLQESNNENDSRWFLAVSSRPLYCTRWRSPGIAGNWPTVSDYCCARVLWLARCTIILEVSSSMLSSGGIFRHIIPF